MNVILIGEAPLAPALAERAQQRGQAVTLIVVSGAMPTDDTLAPAQEATLAVELVDTDLTLKRAVIAALDARLPAEAALATSILAAAAAEVAGWRGRAERPAGLALLPPLGDASVAEIATLPGGETAAQAARAWLEALGLDVAEIADSVGGVLPRVVACLANEAAFALGEGVASVEDIDRAMQLGTAYPRGPLAWANAIGYRRVAAILDGLNRDMPDGRYGVAPWLRRQARLSRSE